MMHLKEILCQMTVLEIEGPADRQVRNLAWDPRRAGPGTLFFAISPDPAQAYADAQTALRQGAAGIVARRGAKLRRGETRIEVPEARLALGEAAAAFYGHPSERLKVLLVTGSHGHWRGGLILKQLLEGCGIKTALLGTIEHQIGDRVLPAGADYPLSLEIQQLLAHSERAGCAACVIEAPLGAAAPERFARLALDAAVITHLPLQAPGSELARVLQGSARKALCVVSNADDRGVSGAAGRLGRELAVSYGLDAPADVSASNLECTLEGSRFTLALPHTRFPCQTALIGRQNASHLLGAAAAAVCLDIDPLLIESSISGFSRLAGLTEPAGCRDGQVLVDGASAAEEIREVLSSLKELARGRVLAVLGRDWRSTGRERFETGRAAGVHADYLVLTSDNPGREPAEQISSAIAQGIEQAGGASYHFQPNRAAAIGEALDMAEPGDLVVILGKGARKRQELAYTIVPFDDAECAREFLAARPLKPAAENRLLAPAVPL